MKRPGLLFGLRRATDDSLNYLARYLVAGLAPVMLIGLLIGPGLLIIHLVSLGAVLPGSIALNFAALRRRRWRDRRRDPHRSRRAAWLTVALFWVGAIFIVAIPVRPSVFVDRLLGSKWAFDLHIGTWMILSSTLGQIAAWSGHPRAIAEKSPA